MKRHRRRRPISDINVVPYLDVLLVLLVIFMVTAPLFNQGAVDVPGFGENPLPAAEVGLVIEYKSADDGYRLIDHKYGGDFSGLSFDELLEKLQQKEILYGSEDGPPKILLSADRNLVYEEVTELLGKLHEAGYTNTSLGVQVG